MNVENFALACRFLPSTYVEQGKQSRKSHENYIKILLEHKKLPVKGWDRSTIEMLLNEISTMDSNNFLGNAGIGEREGRIASPIVVQRHYGLAHGIGRSGDIAAVQPKAAGSSLMMKLTNAMVLDAIRIAGVRSASSCIVVPMATGMSMVLTFLTIKQMRPEAKYIIWPRVDQKSCFKAIFTAGFEPIVIENILVEDELRTDVQMIEKHLKGIPPEQILCIYTTTSCFTPRAPDSLEAIGKLCKEFEIPHVVNNAYGLQSSKCTHLIEQAARSGRLDAFIQSTDKNFMVPVGGAVIAGFDDGFISKISQTYPGRASAAPVMDLFVTLLSMGVEGFKDSLIERKGMYRYLQKRLQQVASAHGERLLVTPNNAISIGITLSSMPTKHATELGSMLFTRNISGARAIAPGVTKQIGSVTFENYGSHYNNYPYAYLTAAAAIGLKKDDVNTFARRLDRVFRKLIKRNMKRRSIEKIVTEKLSELDIKWSDFSSQEDDGLEGGQNQTHLTSAKNSAENLLTASKSNENLNANDSNSDIGVTDIGIEKGTDSSEGGVVIENSKNFSQTNVTNQADNPTAAFITSDNGNPVDNTLKINIINDETIEPVSTPNDIHIDS